MTVKIKHGHETNKNDKFTKGKKAEAKKPILTHTRRNAATHPQNMSNVIQQKWSSQPIKNMSNVTQQKKSQSNNQKHVKCTPAKKIQLTNHFLLKMASQYAVRRIFLFC